MIQPAGESDAIDSLVTVTRETRGQASELVGKGLAVDVQVDANAEYEIGDAGGLGAEFDQDSRGLESIEQHVVGPLQFDLIRVWNRAGDGLGDTDRGRQDPGSL